MAFYKCDDHDMGSAQPCGVGTNSARQCGVNPCKHVVSFCEVHGGDAAAIDAIRKHMRDAHGRTDL